MWRTLPCSCYIRSNFDAAKHARMRLLARTGTKRAPSALPSGSLCDISVFSIGAYIVFMIHLWLSRTGNCALVVHAAEVKHHDSNHAIGRRWPWF
jgi:hypothetical protein